MINYISIIATIHKSFQGSSEKQYALKADLVPEKDKLESPKLKS